MQTLYAVINPFKAAENIYRVMNKNSILIFSDVFNLRYVVWPITPDAPINIIRIMLAL